MPWANRDAGDAQLQEPFERFDGQLVSPGGAVALLGVSRKTVHTLGKRGRLADTRIAQHLLGHAHLGTSETYLGRPRLDDMATAVKNASYGTRTNVLGAAETPQIGLKASTGIEPV